MTSGCAVSHAMRSHTLSAMAWRRFDGARPALPGGGGPGRRVAGERARRTVGSWVARHAWLQYFLCRPLRGFPHSRQVAAGMARGTEAGGWTRNATPEAGAVFGCWSTAGALLAGRFGPPHRRAGIAAPSVGQVGRQPRVGLVA